MLFVDTFLIQLDILEVENSALSAQNGIKACEILSKVYQKQYMEKKKATESTQKEKVRINFQKKRGLKAKKNAEIVHKMKIFFKAILL